MLLEAVDSPASEAYHRTIDVSTAVLVRLVNEA